MYLKILLYSSILTKLIGFLNIYFNKQKTENFKILGNKVLLLPLVRYTNSSIFLLIIWIYHKLIYKNVSSGLTCLVWCILSNVSLGYWLVVKDKNLKYNNYLEKISDFMHHGGLLLLFSPYILKHSFKITEIKIPLIFSIFWLLFVIFPWYYITDDPIYPFLNKKNSNLFKIKMLSLMLLINIFTGTIGSTLSNNFKIIYKN